MKPVILEQFGLNEKEANVYLAALELGSAPVQKIAQKAGLKRPTAYVIIRGLIEKGLMSSYTEGKKQMFAAEPPERLHKFLESQKRSIEEKKNELEKILPDLKSLHNISEGKPVVRFFEGKEGLLSMSDEFLGSGETKAVMFYPEDLVQKYFAPALREMARERRKKQGIEARSIYTSEENILEDTELSTRKKIPSQKFPLNCDITVYGNKVRIVSMGDRLMGIVIDDKNIADTFRTIFNLSWEAAEKYDTEEKKKKQ